MRFVIDSDKLSKEEIEKLLKQAGEASAEVLQEGKDAFVYTLTPDVLRSWLDDLRDEDGKPSSKLSDAGLLDFVDDWVASGIDEYAFDNMKEQYGDGYFDGKR